VSAPADLLGAGRVGRPHGLDGSFHVTRPRVRLLLHGMPVQVAGRATTIERRAGTDDRPIVRLEGVAGREAAEALRGEDLLVARADAPPLDEGEFLAEDVVGLRVVDGDQEVGEVRRLLAYPSCDLLEVRRAGGGELLVPLVEDAVRDLDLEARVVDVDLAFLDAEDA
jgi:16S rRNA processing protein RimM